MKLPTAPLGPLPSIIGGIPLGGIEPGPPRGGPKPCGGGRQFVPLLTLGKPGFRGDDGPVNDPKLSCDEQGGGTLPGPPDVPSGFDGMPSVHKKKITTSVTDELKLLLF